MNYPISYWKTGDLVALDLHHAKGMLFVFLHPYKLEYGVAVLYCINDGTYPQIHASYIREIRDPKKQ
jgi:hypothetical protein